MLKGAGKIGAVVREFMIQELELRVEVPALDLLPDGKAMGGSLEDGQADVLESTRSLAGTEPGIVLGPDTVATLSFTSGSTGIPKGVKGRHYSLTHFFPWMGERFNLGEHSKFTMLSGIAHDPIQRDSESSLVSDPRLVLIIVQSSLLSSSVLNYMCQLPTILAPRVVSLNGWRTVK